MSKFSKPNKAPYAVFKIKKYFSKRLFLFFEWFLNKFGREIKIKWSNNRKMIPCEKIPHIHNWSNRFEDYTYRLEVTKIKNKIL